MNKLKGVLTSVIIVFCFLGLFPLTGYADDNVADIEQNSDIDESDERIVPQYNGQYIDYFYAGDTYIQVKIWIDVNTGGVTLTSSDYCDFTAEGYVEDDWGERHYYNASNDYTTYCQAYGGCYVTLQQITIVHVKVTASSSSGTGVYENTVPITAMELV